MFKGVECPVCNKSFTTSVISEHVDICLNNVDNCYDRNQTNTESKKIKEEKQASHTPISEGKKRKLSDWSFMTSGSKKQDNSKPNHSDKSKISIENKTDSELQHVVGANMEAVQEKAQPLQNIPLAEKMRPQSFENFVGQEQSVAKESLLMQVLRQGKNIPSIILYGPPGCGKTTFARIIAQRMKSQGNVKYVSMSATKCGVNDVKELAKVAVNDFKMLHKRTILFLDEIHRFNKTQQDALLPYVEDGTLTLIGATTENPSFNVNSALLSRCRLITFEKLTMEQIKLIIIRALKELDVTLIQAGKTEATESRKNSSLKVTSHSKSGVAMEEDAVETLAGLVDGDARAALNGLQLSVQGSLAKVHQDTPGNILITSAVVREALQRSHILYDKSGEEHYNTISAMIKSMRGSDASAALYWMTIMLEGGENPLFVARRLIVFASEDIGLADSGALNLAVSTHQACHAIGMPECALNLAHCVIYLARAPKSTEVLQGLQAAQKCVRNHQGPLPPVPLHLRNAPNKFLKNLGYGEGYKYPPAHSEPVQQSYFPASLTGTDFFK